MMRFVLGERASSCVIIVTKINPGALSSPAGFLYLVRHTNINKQHSNVNLVTEKTWKNEWFEKTNEAADGQTTDALVRTQATLFGSSGYRK